MMNWLSLAFALNLKIFGNVYSKSNIVISEIDKIRLLMMIQEIYEKDDDN